MPSPTSLETNTTGPRSSPSTPTSRRVSSAMSAPGHHQIGEPEREAIDQHDGVGRRHCGSTPARSSGSSTVVQRPPRRARCSSMRAAHLAVPGPARREIDRPALAPTIASAKRLLPDRAPPRTRVTLRRVGVSTVITHLRRFTPPGHLRAGRTIRAPPHPVNARLSPPATQAGKSPTRLRGMFGTSPPCRRRRNPEPPA